MKTYRGMEVFLARVRDFSTLQSIQAACGVYSAFYSIGTSSSFLRDEIDNSHLVRRSRMMEIHLHSAIRLYGRVLNYLCTNTFYFIFMLSYSPKLTDSVV
jgi:hypothetical protein